MLTPLHWVGAVFAGLLLGSFFNVVLYRLPKTSAAGLLQAPKHTLWYLAYPYSFCPHCQTSIRPWHNIPLLSFVLLRARAACCGRDISVHYPLVELAGVAVVCVALWFYYPNWINMVFAIVFLSVLFVASAIDWQRYYLLDILTLPLLWVGLLANLDTRFVLLEDAVLGVCLGYVGLHLLIAAFSWVVRRRAMGGGDPKLFAAIGAWLGWQALPLVLFIAAVLGLALGAARYVRRGRGRHIPFAPCLSVAAVVMLFYGDAITLAYWQFVSP